jgi:hypothetical protein
MKALLIRLYPARWRARYGEEFLAILEERPLGPFDVADILLGALDAQLRLRGAGSQASQTRGITMSLRIGGIAAIIGAPLWTGGFMLSNGVFGNVDLRTAAVLMVAGSLALLVALAGLSAFQARVQPVLSWIAFALPAVGTIALTLGAFSVALGGELTDAFFFGFLTFFVGSSLFAIATYRTAVLSRPAAALLGVAPVLAYVAGGGSDGGSRPLFIVAGLICFTLAWVALGVQAIRVDRPSTAATPV